MVIEENCHPKYSIKKELSGKAVLLDVIGDYSKNDVEDFKADLRGAIGWWDPKEVSLVVNCAKLEMFSATNVMHVREVVTFVKRIGFKEVFGVPPESSIVDVQLSRILKEVGLNVKAYHSVAS